MSDQPTTRRIEFTITGDDETDFINGILAVLHPVGQDILDSAILRQRMRTRQRVCAYLEERFRWMADEADTQQRNIDSVRQSAAPIYNPYPERHKEGCYCPACRDARLAISALK